MKLLYVIRKFNPNAGSSVIGFDLCSGRFVVEFANFLTSSHTQGGTPPLTPCGRNNPFLLDLTTYPRSIWCYRFWDRMIGRGSVRRLWFCVWSGLPLSSCWWCTILASSELRVDYRTVNLPVIFTLENCTCPRTETEFWFWLRPIENPSKPSKFALVSRDSVMSIQRGT